MNIKPVVFLVKQGLFLRNFIWVVDSLYQSRDSQVLAACVGSPHTTLLNLFDLTA